MVFCFIQKKFPGQHESYNIYFFCRTKRNFFSPKFNIRLYDKNSESELNGRSLTVKVKYISSEILEGTLQQHISITKRHNPD